MNEQEGSPVDEESWFQERRRVLDEIEARDDLLGVRIAESELRLKALLRNRPEPKAAEYGEYDDYEVAVPPKQGVPAPAPLE